MKNLLYSLIFFLGLATTAIAQQNRTTLIPAKIVQRSVMVGGGVTGAYRDISDHFGNEERSSSRQEFDIDAKIGYFILHDVAVGLRGTLHHFRVQVDGDHDTRSAYLLAGPFARYYLDNGLFGEASYSVGLSNQPGSIKTDITEIRGGVGYALFINPKIAIEPAIMLTRYKEKQATEGNGYITEFGPSFNLGLQVYLFREREVALLR